MPVADEINKLYDKVGYIDKYGMDLLVGIILVFTVCCGNLSFYINNHLQGLKQQWNDPSGNIRCDPFYIPFASTINPPPKGTSNLQYIEQNLEYCTKNTLKGVGESATSPLKGILDTMLSVFKDIATTLDELMKFLEKFVSSILELMSTLFANVGSYTSGVSSVFDKITGFLSKSMAINEVLMYMLSGFVDVIMALIPSPSCFDENTLLTLYDGTKKCIANIKVGDRLLHDGIVTSTFIFTAKHVPMYLYNGVKVSDSHYVYTIDGFKRVNEINESVPIVDYNKEFIYCLSTELKQITIDNIVFADYDDLDNQDCYKLIKWINARYAKDKPSDSRYNIHKYLNGGLVDTPLLLEDGEQKYLSSIQIGEMLQGGIQVVGKVQVLSDSINIKKVVVGENYIQGGHNIQIMDKTTGCGLNIMDSLEESLYPKTKLYHLITNKGGYYVNNVYIGDYSVGMNLFFKDEIQEVVKRV